MLLILNQVNDQMIERLFLLYEESMRDLRKNFNSDFVMKESYRRFISEFIADPKQLVLVEEVNGIWVSSLRAIESEAGKWFFEAVETMPKERRKGYGKELLFHALEYLREKGMSEVTCTIAKTNTRSMKLHEKCGFVSTNDVPLNPWGQVEEKTILYRYCK